MKFFNKTSAAFLVTMMFGFGSNAMAETTCTSAKAKELAGKAVSAIRSLSGTKSGKIGTVDVTANQGDGYRAGVEVNYPGVIGSDAYDVVLGGNCVIYKVEYTGSLE